MNATHEGYGDLKPAPKVNVEIMVPTSAEAPEQGTYHHVNGRWGFVPDAQPVTAEDLPVDARNLFLEGNGVIALKWEYDPQTDAWVPLNPWGKQQAAS